MKNSLIGLGRNLLLPVLTAFLGSASAVTYTVSKDGRGAFSTIQAAVEKAGKGDIVEILDAAVYAEQVTIDSNRHGLTLRSANPQVLKKPVIRYQDKTNVGPRTCQEALDPKNITFDQNGALRILRARNVTIDGIAVDGVAPAPFGWAGVWGNGVDCNGQTWANFHGNGGIALFVSGDITIRNSEVYNAYFGIAVKDRNEGGIFANVNPGDLEKSNVVPLSGFGRTGNHVFEKNRIHNNTWGLFFESVWDLGSTVRYNLIYENHHPSSAAATAVKALPEGANQPGGAFLFKDVMLTPLAIYNNTLWHNFYIFVGGYRPGAQHLVFNNIYAQPHSYWSQDKDFNLSWMSLDLRMVNRMKHCLYAAQSIPPASQLRNGNVEAQLFDNTLNQTVRKDSIVSYYQDMRIMDGMGNVAKDSILVHLTLPMSSGPVVETRVIRNAALPGNRIVGADAAAPAFPAAANNRWYEIKFKSTDPASPDFLAPDWEDSIVKAHVMNGGWPPAGIFNADGKVADLGAIPSSDRHADDYFVRSLSPVIISGSTATLNFNLSGAAAGLGAPRIKYLKLVRGLPLANVQGTDFGAPALLVVPPAVDVTPPATPLKMGGNTLEVTGFGAMTENYAFFEMILEGTAANGKPTTTNVGFLPYRKLEYKFVVEVLDAAGVKTNTVKVGQPVQVRIIPQSLNGTPYANAIKPVAISLNSGNDLLAPGNPPVKLSLPQVQGTTLAPAMFEKVPNGGIEYVTVSGIWKSTTGTNTLAFYGVSEGIRILPGDPEKVVFQDPPSKILSPGSAPVIDPGQGYAVKVQVQDIFGNAVGAGVQVSIKSNHPAIGDLEGAATPGAVVAAATDSNGIATFRARVTDGDLDQIFELEASVPGKPADKADLKVGQPRDRLWILYADVVTYNPNAELRGTAGARLPVTIRAGKTADVKLADKTTAIRVEASAGLAVYASLTDAAPQATFSLAAGEVVVYVTGLRAVDNGSLTVSPVTESILPVTRAKIYFTFSPDAVQSASVHADNGFGRVDGLRLRFGKDLKAAPDSIALSWPAPGQNTRMIRTGIVLDPADPRRVTVALPEPFPAGLTTFAGSNALGTAYVFDPATPEIPPQALPFPVADSVGPLLDSARVQEKLEVTDDTLFIAFSEKLSPSSLLGASLQLIKRAGGAPLTLTVLTGSDLADGRYFRIAVSNLGAQAPAEGDSLKIHPAGPLTDAYGNRAHALNRPVPLSLKTVPKPPVLVLSLDRGYDKGQPRANAADFVIFSVGADSVLTPVLGSDRRGAVLECAQGQIRCGDPTAPGAGPGAPSITIVTDRAVTFNVAIFTNLGGFVNSVAGTITNEQLGLDEKGLPGPRASLFRKDEKGRFVVRLAWNTRSHDQAQAGTGAYLARVNLSSRAEDNAGKPYALSQGKTYRFGVLRQ